MSQIINKYYCLPMYVFRLSNRPTYLFETIYKEKYFVRKRFLFFSPSFLVEKHNKIKLWIEDTTETDQWRYFLEFLLWNLATEYFVFFILNILGVRSKKRLQ